MDRHASSTHNPSRSVDRITLIEMNLLHVIIHQLQYFPFLSVRRFAFIPIESFWRNILFHFPYNRRTSKDYMLSAYLHIIQIGTN